MKWLKGPTHPGAWWYWLLGSGIVRHTNVFRCVGFFQPELKGKLQVMTDGPRLANQTARLWAKSANRPKLPPLKMRKELERKHCHGLRV